MHCLCLLSRSSIHNYYVICYVILLCHFAQIESRVLININTLEQIACGMSDTRNDTAEAEVLSLCNRYKRTYYWLLVIRHVQWTAIARAHVKDVPVPVKQRACIVTKVADVEPIKSHVEIR